MEVVHIGQVCLELGLLARLLLTFEHGFQEADEDGLGEGRGR